MKPIMATKTVEELDMNLPESDKSEVTLAGIHEDGAIESEDDAEALRGEDDDEAGDALIEDASDLCADDDDMAEVIERLGEDRDV
ncbi:hypothetical protein RIEGSTA812A_PEG_168 [invertebrate metagenome]|uniref:Uncharacterized protein n=1 Tax=invertebrate metagenome TaxID=1711999 RepID=A0A484H5W5_9ZZZZ